MAQQWINPTENSFNRLLLLERFQIQLMLEVGGWYKDKSIWKECLAVALQANPAVSWYLKNRCPECAAMIDEILQSTPPLSNPDTIRQAECIVLAGIEDFVIYSTPEQMVINCDFIKGWCKEHLYDLVELTGKIVLDVGAGAGRLTFAAAEKAAWVYASEPVGTLREYMRDIIAQESISNVRVVDGLVTALPYANDHFDVVMSGHVLGCHWVEELRELSRVCKPCGWLIDCPGDSQIDIPPKKELLAGGWQEFHYVGSYGKSVYTYRKQVSK